MARRRSGLRRAGAGWKVTPGLMLAVLFGIGALALIAVRGASAPGQAIGDDAAAVAGRVATGPVRSSENVFDRIGAMWGQTERIEQLERENRELLAWRELAERLAERNARYEALLRMPEDAFGAGADIEHAIAAQLVLDSGGPFTRTLVANAGRDHGVRVGYIAVNENGLVGRVVSVGRRSSRVLMLDDYSSRIPVMGEASRVRAVLAGQATQPPELFTRPFEVQPPRLDFVVGEESLREGERMVTSGDGGLYPRGIPVGVARRSGDGQWRVALASSRRPIDFVRLIPYAGAELPESAPVPDEGPPLSAASSVAAIGREQMAPPPVAAPAPTTPRVRRPTVETAAATPAPAEAPAEEAPAEDLPVEEAPAGPQ